MDAPAVSGRARHDDPTTWYHGDMPEDDLADVIATLRSRRAAHAASVELLDQAIKNLSNLPGRSQPVPDKPAVEIPPAPTPAEQTGAGPTGKPKSVMKSIIDLAAEGPADWSADSIIKEYERRGQPLEVKDPMNAVFSALSRAQRRGDLVRTGHGTYRHPDYVDQWTANADGSHPHEIEFTVHPVSELDDENKESRRQVGRKKLDDRGLQPPVIDYMPS